MDVTRLDEEHALIPRREVELHQRIEEEADRFIHELRVIVPDTKVVLEERGGQPEDEFIAWQHFEMIHHQRSMAWQASNSVPQHFVARVCLELEPVSPALLIKLGLWVNFAPALD